MFSHEGYLTNTLPVTPAQHVIAKVIVGAVNYMISFLVIYLGMLILSAGSGNAGEFRRIMDFSFKLLDKFDMLFPTFLMMATGYLALLLCCYMLSSISSMIGGSKGKSAALAVLIIIGYIMLTTLISSSMQSTGTSYGTNNRCKGFASNAEPFALQLLIHTKRKAPPSDRIGPEAVLYYMLHLKRWASKDTALTTTRTTSQMTD